MKTLYKVVFVRGPSIEHYADSSTLCVSEVNSMLPDRQIAYVKDIWAEDKVPFSTLSAYERNASRTTPEGFVRGTKVFLKKEFDLWENKSLEPCVPYTVISVFRPSVTASRKYEVTLRDADGDRYGYVFSSWLKLAEIIEPKKEILLESIAAATVKLPLEIARSKSEPSQFLFYTKAQISDAKKAGLNLHTALELLFKTDTFIRFHPDDVQKADLCGFEWVAEYASDPVTHESKRVEIPRVIVIGNILEEDLKLICSEEAVTYIVPNFSPTKKAEWILVATENAYFKKIAVPQGN